MLLPADQFAARVLLGPALRTQPDGRLVRLVGEGHEAAFEEIVRRYRRPLGRFAASIVGAGRAEDVTQDSFSKALRALRRTESEIELRPWLYRIVRNTALNDLRDRPADAEELPEALSGGPSAATEAERREELADLVARLRALPETQREAMVMRELGGHSHEEIGAELGLSGGGARQAIHRARTALRDGVGLLLPLPLLRLLAGQGTEATAGAGTIAAVGAAGGGGAAALGAGGALKLGAATLLIAGSVSAGVAIHHEHDGRQEGRAAGASELADRSGSGEEDQGRSVEPGDDRSSDALGRGRDNRGKDDSAGSESEGDRARDGGPGPSAPQLSPGDPDGGDSSDSSRGSSGGGHSEDQSRESHGGHDSSGADDDGGSHGSGGGSGSSGGDSRGGGPGPSVPTIVSEPSSGSSGDSGGGGDPGGSGSSSGGPSDLSESGSPGSSGDGGSSTSGTSGGSGSTSDGGHGGSGGEIDGDS